MFWLSLYPQDYKRLIKSTRWRDPLDIRARVLVFEWARNITRSTQCRSEWLQDQEAEGRHRQNTPQPTAQLTKQDQQINAIINRFDDAVNFYESHSQRNHENDDASIIEYRPTSKHLNKRVLTNT
ncbi:hypothetical protein ACJMK2_042965 [Sinanodonta woodiana]|uniref:Uncharacterized protein n=1 Tax=Sinanodonta woodiana TaxID=1069815 RepID=A0ABD3VW87_SINWO